MLRTILIPILFLVWIPTYSQTKTFDNLQLLFYFENSNVILVTDIHIVKDTVYAKYEDIVAKKDSLLYNNTMYSLYDNYYVISFPIDNYKNYIITEFCYADVGIFQQVKKNNIVYENYSQSIYKKIKHLNK